MTTTAAPAPAPREKPTVDVTAETFREATANGIVLIDFWASWCGPCRAFAPVFEAAASRHQDIVFAKVNTEHQRDLAAAFSIRAIPTLGVFRDGLLLALQPGALPANALDALIADVRALDMDQIKKDIAEKTSVRKERV